MVIWLVTSIFILFFYFYNKFLTNKFYESKTILNLEINSPTSPTKTRKNSSLTFPRGLPSSARSLWGQNATENRQIRRDSSQHSSNVNRVGASTAIQRERPQRLLYD